MKLQLIPALLTVGAASAFANDPAFVPSPRVEVTVQSEAKELARGYALAFSTLSRPPITMALQKSGTVFVLEDVKGVRDSGGILVVEVGRGMIYLVNAQDVIYLTDGKVIPLRSEPAAK